MENDTDLLLAMTASLLEDGGRRDQSTLLNALLETEGDPTAAAELVKKRVLKRTRGHLDDWISSTSPTKTAHKPFVHNQANAETSAVVAGIRTAAGPVQLPPITLTSPEQIAKRTPCTLHNSILSPKLASQLYYELVDKSAQWKPNKWWLIDKLVESPHKTTFLVRKDPGSDVWKESAQLWYNGRQTPPPDSFTPLIEIACQEVEKCVNIELAKRARFPLEFAGSEWRANVAAVNCYDGSKEGVGLHSDQLTHLGPYPTIASLSLGTTRKFRLREVVAREQASERKARTIDIPLVHNSLIIMHASAQENYKHAIPTQRVIDAFRPPFTRDGLPTNEADSLNIRINITFRFYRPDFKPSSIPRCNCNVPCILRPDMKGRNAEGLVTRYWWSCYSGAQNEGKGCSVWQVLDCKAEKRGPFVGH